MYVDILKAINFDSHIYKADDVNLWKNSLDRDHS